jgi:D-sedoheptulose 7-phosphate isomerase
MRDEILNSVRECVSAINALAQPQALAFMEALAEMLADAFRTNHKVLIAGNGGSLCDAMHFAEELTGQFRASRPALPAIALSDPAHLTCCGNDMGFDAVFSRGIEALGQPGDIFIGLTTSGNSPNIVRAFATAKSRGLYTIAFLGKDGGKCKGMADRELIIPGFGYSDRIQEAHMAAIHIVIERVEALLFTETFAAR